MSTVHLLHDNGIIEDLPLGCRRLHETIKEESADIKNRIRELELKYVKPRGR